MNTPEQKTFLKSMTVKGGKNQTLKAMGYGRQ